MRTVITRNANACRPHNANDNQAAVLSDKKSSAVTAPSVAALMASNCGRRGSLPATYRDTAACVVPIRSAKSACDSLLRFKNSASVMQARYQSGMGKQALHTNLVLEPVRKGEYHVGMNRFRQRMEQVGISQGRLAKLVGTSQPQISRLGKEANHPDFRKMTVEWALRLAPHLDCRPIDLLPPEMLGPQDSVDDLLDGAPDAVREEVYRAVVQILTRKLSA